MKKNSIIFVLLPLIWLMMSCNVLDGDNSDYPFGDNFEEQEDVYKNGYGRLDNTYRIATYNVHICAPIGSSTGNYNNITKAISLMSPDVIGIQELDKENERNPENQLQMLSERTNMNGHFCKTLDFRGGEYGIGILYAKHLTLNSIAEIELPGSSEARKALIAEFDHFVFINTHLSLNNEERLESIRLINQYVTTNLADYDKPIFMVGDLNEPSIISGFFIEILKSWSPTSANKNTFIGSASYTRIDYVMRYDKNQAPCDVVGSAVPTYNEIDLYKCSDHLPVLVDIKK